MNQGCLKVFEYIMHEGFSNIRSILKRKNHLEIENDVLPVFNVSFFLTQIELSNIELVKRYYYELIDIMQVTDFIEILNYQSGSKSARGSPTTIANFIMTDEKFQNMFTTSLEV